MHIESFKTVNPVEIMKYRNFGSGKDGLDEGVEM